MRIMAIDQARTGAWSVYDYESGQLIGYGTYTFSTKKYTYAQTIMHIEELVDAVARTYRVSAIFIEDIQLRANVKSFKKLAQLQGVLVNFCEKHDYLYGYIAPSQWQNFCKARGRNTKELNAGIKSVELADKKKSKILSIQFVKEQFGIDTENDNLADAICIGYYAVKIISIDTKDQSILTQKGED